MDQVLHVSQSHTHGCLMESCRVTEGPLHWDECMSSYIELLQYWPPLRERPDLPGDTAFWMLCKHGRRKIGNALGCRGHQHEVDRIHCTGRNIRTVDRW